MGILDKFRKKKEENKETTRTKRIDYLSFERSIDSNICSYCSSHLEDFVDEGIILTKCKKCGIVRPKRGAMYDTETIMRIATKYPNFRP